ncbi:phage tail tape measure protein [Streptomyces achromogenes]|uniref:phage tail tape measure protein n=1 Tax=Streptomyces achromogenes TaxID=67255 RepID=UPI0036BA0FD7
MPSVGYATIQIIPSVRGISDEIRRQLVGPAGDAGGQAGEAAGSSLLDKLKVGAAAAGAAAGAILVKGLGDAIDQANVTSKLQAQLGTSNKVAAQQGKLAGKLYSSGVSNSFESAADAIKSVMQSGLAPPGTTTKQLESLATKASDVANVFDQDLGGVTNAVSQMLRTGLAKNATEAFDLITKGFQGGADKAGDLLDTFNEYGTSFRTIGLSGRDAMGLLQQGLQGGARDADQVADALKEFGLVASQGGKPVEDAFKAIGLNGKQMVTDVAAGGDSAREAIGKVLARLAELPASADKANAVKTLFGGPGEDLGASLFALNLDKASTSLGKVSGAADQAGKTIRSGPQYEIQTFTRTLQQGLVNFIGGKVLPTLTTLATGFTTYLLPPLRTVGTVLAATLIPALTGLRQTGLSVVNWLRGMGTWLIPIGVAVVGFTAALLAQQIATAGVTLVFSLYRGAILAWTAVQRGATIAQAAFNAVMNANPVILVITAIVALGAALVIAYQRSETFRSIVQAAWAGIQTAALYVWNSVLKPAFAGIMTALSALGTAFQWLWSSVIQPVFGFISTAARILLTVITIVVFGPIYLAVKLLGAVFSWLWTNAISPVVGWIVAGLGVLWTGAKTIFGYFMTGLRVLGGWAKWLWTNAISPVVGWVVDGFRLLWTGVKVVFGWFTAGIKTLAGWAKWLWTNAIKPAFDGIASVVSTVYDHGIKPVFDSLKSAVGQVGKAFEAAKDAVKIAWDKVKGIAKEPVSFIVNTVYNKGIVGVWNKVAGAFGAPKLDTYKFATGGVLPGYTPGRDVHLAALSGGEAVMRPEWTRAVGPGYVHAMNAAARTGGVTGVQRALGLPGFADGGIFGWVGKAGSKLAGAGSDVWEKVKKGASWLKDGIKASALSGLNSIVKPLINKISGSASLYRDMITNVPKKMITSILGYSDKADKGLEKAGIGGKGYKAALAWARTQNGKPYQWGGNGDPSWDCSGFMSAIESVIRGQTPHRRWATGSFSGSSAPPGWVLGARSPFMIGITNAGVGHTAGTLNGVNVESRGGDGVIVGSRARGYSNSLFTDVYGFKGYANGGSPRPGEIAWVGENGPELIRFSGGEVVYSNAQSRRMAAGLGGLRGFAKGTSKATTARKQVPGDLGSFTKSLTGSASQISSAAKELAKDLKAAGGAGKGLAASTLKTNTKLQALAKQRDSVASKLATARQAAVDQRQTASDYLGLSNLSDATSADQLIFGLQGRQAGVKGFQDTISKLSKKGLSRDLISQLVAMGPDSSLATVVADASKAQIAQLNALATSGAKLSTSYGNTMADAMYDAGTNASRGFLAGLQSQEKELQAAMNRLGDGLVASIKKKLKIHSPSRVTHALGANTGQGYALGLDSTASQVAAAAARISDAAVPAAARVGATTAPMRAAVGLQRGDQLRLVVDGYEFSAYVDERVAARDTRMSMQASAKRRQ